jgi:hypothetical protein
MKDHFEERKKVRVMVSPFHGVASSLQKFFSRSRNITIRNKKTGAAGTKGALKGCTCMPNKLH